MQQLSDSLLEMEEERAIWSAKEKASIEAIGEKAKSYNVEIMMLSKEMAQVRSIFHLLTACLMSLQGYDFVVVICWYYYSS